MKTIQLETQHTSGVYAKREVVMVRGQGARLWDENGRAYIDCAAGIGVANVGHGHTAIAAAIAQQAHTLITCPEFVYNDRRAELLARLTAVLPDGLDRVFLCNSGTEAIEAAIKFARLSTGRTEIVAAMRGFHGRTYGSLSATHKNEYREPFLPLVPGFSHVPFGNEGRLRTAVTPQTAAVILEIVQGEGGVRPGPPAYFQTARQLCDETGALLIIDEVQTGFGRTGRWFACEHTDLVPDIIALGKAIAGGLPMGAAVIGPRVAQLPANVHGSTFGGNPLACAAALATLQAIADENLVSRAAELGDYLRQRLQQINSPLIREVRGLGLMVGVELKVHAMPIVLGMMARGVLALTAGPTVIRLLPPLVIGKEELDQVVRALERELEREREG
ncbi:MAG: aspartate aminotransferase family protein [Chloroflexi bacterium]|nr:aspartate aminotransferase family protein [Chloroflexota bacterium]